MQLHSNQFHNSKLYLAVSRPFLILLVGLFFCVEHSYSQKKLTDSLIQKKTALENRVGFKATDTSYIKVLYELGRSYIYQVPDSTKSISDKVINLSEQAGFAKGIAAGKSGVGLYHILKGKYELGFSYADESIQLAEKVGADSILLKSINVRAMGSFMKGDYPEAYRQCIKGLDYAKRFKTLDMQVFFTMNLATSFAILKEYEQALPYYEDALKLVEKTNEQVHRAQIHSNLGYMYLHTGDFKKARDYCNKAISVLSKNEFQAWESFAWATLGEVAIQEKEYDKAISFFKKSEALLLTIEDQQRKAETWQGFADAHFLKNDFEKSMDYALRADSISKGINYHNGIVKSSELLYKLALQKNNTNAALNYLKTAKHLSDSILESENRTKFLMLEAQAKFDQDQKQFEFENQKKLSKQKTITYISTILLIALLIIVLLIRKNAINQKRANVTLRKLNETKDRLFSIIGHDLKAPIGTLQELLELYHAKEISEKEMAQLAPRLKKNVDHSSFTLNNLLYWAKTQMKGIEPNITEIDIKEKATEICDSFNSRIEAKNISVKCTIDSNHKILVDPMHADIILRNIISNAIKYTKESGEIFLSSTNGQGKVRIEVCDTGIGMDEKTLSSILRGDHIKSRPGTRKEKGTGIGLQITKELIKGNHGDLGLKSEQKKGTCIVISLPAA